MRKILLSATEFPTNCPAKESTKASGDKITNQGNSPIPFRSGHRDIPLQNQMANSAGSKSDITGADISGVQYKFLKAGIQLQTDILIYFNLSCCANLYKSLIQSSAVLIWYSHFEKSFTGRFFPDNFSSVEFFTKLSQITTDTVP